MSDLLLGQPKDVVFHHSASKRDSTSLEDIQKWHTAPKPEGRGWERVGYHYVIESAPVVVRPALPLYRLGIHVKGQNTGKIGVCITGDNRDPDQRWTAMQITAAYRLREALQTLYPAMGCGGHRDFDANRTCPELDINWAFDLIAAGGEPPSLDFFRGDSEGKGYA